MATCEQHASEELRSKARYQGVAITALASMASKSVVLLTAMIAVPLTLPYLGRERYGLWMTITSAVLFLSSADLGIGSGLTVTIAECDATGETNRALRSVSSAFFALMGIAVAASLLFWAGQAWIPWDSLLNPTNAGVRKDAVQSCRVLFMCTAIALPMGVVARVQLGLQQGHVSEIWAGAANVIALGGVILSVWFHLPMPWLVFSMTGAPLLCAAANGAFQFFFRSTWLRPRWSQLHWYTTMRLLRLGGLFFLQQCFGLTYYLSDNLLISRFRGNAEVAGFSVVQRLFSVALFSQYLMVPLWPAFREAISIGDIDWTRRALKRSLYLNLLAGGVAGVAILYVSQLALYRWAHLRVPALDGLRIGFVPWVILVGFIATMNAFLNQPEWIKRYLLIFGSATRLTLALKVFMVRAYGPAGAVWATVAGYGAFYVIPCLRLANESLQSQAERRS